MPFGDCELPDYALQILKHHDVVQTEVDEFGELQLCVNVHACDVGSGRVASSPATNVLRVRLHSSPSEAHKLDLVLELASQGWAPRPSEQSYNEHVRNFSTDMYLRSKLYFVALLAYDDIKRRHGDRVLSGLPHNYYRALLEAKDLAQLAGLTNAELHALTSAQFEAVRRGLPLAAGIPLLALADAEGSGDDAGDPGLLALPPMPALAPAGAAPPALPDAVPPALADVLGPALAGTNLFDEFKSVTVLGKQIHFSMGALDGRGDRAWIQCGDHSKCFKIRNITLEADRAALFGFLIAWAEQGPLVDRATHVSPTFTWPQARIDAIAASLR